MNFFVRLAVTYAIGTFGGALLAYLHVPLAWMVGSAFAVILASVSGMKTASPRASRGWGQIIVASSIGAQMSGNSLQVILDHGLSMVFSAVCTILAGLFVSAVFARATGVSAIKACLSCIPIGPMEAARLAEIYDIEPSVVALAQAIRIITLVMIIPPVLVWLLQPTDVYAGVTVHDPIPITHTALLLGGASFVGLFCAWLKIPNGAFLGALAFAAVGAILAWPIGVMPHILIVAGQVLLGVSLGTMFQPGAVSRLHFYSLACLVATMAFLLLSLVIAAIISVASNLPIEMAILATAPGSLAEMSLTAKFLHQEPSLVTAYHIMRISIVLLLAPLVFKAAYWLSKKL